VTVSDRTQIVLHAEERRSSALPPRRGKAWWLLLGAIAFAPLHRAAAAQELADASAAAVIYRTTEKRTSDIGPDTRAIRVLVHYSRTKFFVASGRPRGYEHDLMHEFEVFFNRHRKRGQTRIPVVFIPVQFEQLIPKLLEGHGDVAAGLMTITGERARRVAFTVPYLRNVAEVIVAHADAPAVANLEDLAGSRVHVLRGSSFVTSLKLLNKQLSKACRRPVEIFEMQADTTTEDLLEMVNAGMLQYTAADDYMGKLWASVLPNLRVEPVRLSEGNNIAWAVRPDNPRLLAALNDFIARGRDRLPGQAAELHARYFRNLNYLGNNLEPDLLGRKKHLAPYFQSASDRNRFDWLFMLAQGFQESRLDQSARSTAGAVGVMQLLPATGRQMGYRDVAVSAKSNIEAGVKYMRHLIAQYFAEPGLTEAARLDFALAAYNAGPTRIQQMRRLAAQRGLEPDRWFHNVERIVLQEIGEEPVRYVANVHRYYLAYRLAEDLEAGTNDRRPPSQRKPNR
jgi:membrane-bound lytic murein transglycosylase MltF